MNAGASSSSNRDKTREERKEGKESSESNKTQHFYNAGEGEWSEKKEEEED